MRSPGGARAANDDEPPARGRGSWEAARAGSWEDPAAGHGSARTLTGRELLLGSSFHLAAGGGEAGGPGYAAWGRMAVGGFDAEAPADNGTLRLDGEVTTGILGADAEWERWLAGVALSVSSAEGTFDQPGVDSGTVESTLTSVNPYVRYEARDRLTALGLLGYAKERVVFDRPIGRNQGVAHPLAQSWIDLESAWLMAMRGAWIWDNGLPAGAHANAAKYCAGEAAFRACERAVMAHGGMGYAKEFHVERLMREVFIPRIAPVSPEMILNYIAERVLVLPRSY